MIMTEGNGYGMEEFGSKSERCFLFLVSCSRAVPTIHRRSRLICTPPLLILKYSHATELCRFLVFKDQATAE